MLLTIQHIMNAAKIVADVLHGTDGKPPRDLSPHVAYRFHRLLAQLWAVAGPIDARRNDAIKAFNHPSPDVIGEWSVPEASLEEFTAAWQETAAASVEIEVDPIPGWALFDEEVLDVQTALVLGSLVSATA